ncbi:hypothetical protein [Fructilactobacillus carniphilus]|uniref:Polymerase n=1 Tax=Fructilactobacillus carniphilus TaxID=2940297 RepID=A0ABY5BVT6_9LACO|nr:hypothetical protein [Fructilactobacillus carniphilus]USS90341.1 hypothetical protein M3M37_05730 [Fructilactobacillus carniphilus]
MENVLSKITRFFNNFYAKPETEETRTTLVCAFFGIYTFLMFFTLIYTYWTKEYGLFFSPVTKIASAVLIIGCLESILLRKPDSSYIVYFLLIALGLIVKRTSTLSFPLWFFVMLLMINHIDFRKIVKVFFLVTAVMTICTVILGYFNLIPTFSTFRGFTNNGQMSFRQALGFNWVTLPSQLFFYLFLCYIFIKKGKLNKISLFLLFLISCFLYSQTNTRNPFLLELLLIAFFLLMQVGFKYKFLKFFKTNLFKYLSILSMPIASILTIIVSYIGPTSPFMVKFDSIMSGRIGLSHLGIEKYGLSFFGTVIKFKTFSPSHPLHGKYFYLDNSFIQYLLNFGIIFLLVIVILLTAALWIEFKKKHWYVLLIFIFIALHSVGDPQLIYLQYSPFALIIVEVIDRFNLKKFLQATRERIGINED